MSIGYIEFYAAFVNSFLYILTVFTMLTPKTKKLAAANKEAIIKLGWKNIEAKNKNIEARWRYSSMFADLSVIISLTLGASHLPLLAR